VKSAVTNAEVCQTAIILLSKCRLQAVSELSTGGL